MNRLWFAVIFLALSFGLCMYEQNTILTTFNTMSSIFDSIDEDMSNEDYENISKKCDDMNQYWKKQYPILSATNDHASLDDAGVAIDSLKTLSDEKSDDLPSAVEEAKRRLSTIYDSSRPTFGNIF